MAYNKATEEKKWRHWKDAEEKRLRQLGVNEDVINSLRNYDWAVFNSDRRYYEKRQGDNTYLDKVIIPEALSDITSVEDLIKWIDNPQIYQCLLELDKLTLRILVLKINGFTTRDIALALHLSEKAIYRRIDRVKEKIKKI